MDTLNLLREPNYRKTTTIQEMFEYAKVLASNDLHLAAAGVLITLLPSLEGDSRVQVSRMIVNCGIALQNTAFMKLIDNVNDARLTQRVSMLLNTSIHEKYKNRLISSSSEETVHTGGRTRVLICAGGDDLLTQAWANIKSLRDTGCDLPVSIVHANEISESQAKMLSKLNVELMNLKDEPYASRLPKIPGVYENLKGFHIKMAALVATDAEKVILADADILWVTNPEVYLSIDVHTFQDIWHMCNKQHSKSAGTSWLYNIHGMNANVQESESGVVVMNRKVCSRMITSLSRMLEGIDYYFEMSFGDKDLYDIAAHINNIKISKSPMPSMLGYIDGDDFVCQSMQQYTLSGCTSHIHMTLLPFKKEQTDLILPTHFCDDPSKIRFVVRTTDGIKNQTIGSTKKSVKELNGDSVIPFLIRHGYHNSREYSNTQLSNGGHV